MTFLSQLECVAYSLDEGYKIELEDLVTLDDIEIEYLVLNFPKEMAEIMKNKETSEYREKQQYCTACQDEISEKPIKVGKFTYCYRCTMSW